jgi:hypothetical protein
MLIWSQLAKNRKTGIFRSADSRGIQSKVFKDLFSDLYADYLHTAVGAMQSGLAA